MTNTITITAKTIAEQLNATQLSNFNFSSSGILTLVIPTRANSDLRQTMLASEAVLAREWNHPEEDEAWADL
ncbi:MAG: hypothetical protein HY231_01930 [Acidobacteria bacterium]|nr:hypothetical protein [Acidobacteriota bacterium]